MRRPDLFRPSHFRTSFRPSARAMDSIRGHATTLLEFGCVRDSNRFREPSARSRREYRWRAWFAIWKGRRICVKKLAEVRDGPMMLRGEQGANGLALRLFLPNFDG